MALVFPLSTPTTIGIASIELTATNAVAVSRSPFTFSQQVHTYPGQMWSASVTIPPLRKEFVEPWVAMLLGLRGQTGTFLLGDPNNVAPRGTALSFKKNLLTFSEQFDQWFAISGTSIASNTHAAPDGFITADTLEKTEGTFVYFIRKGNTVSGETYTASIYLKQGTATTTVLRAYKNVIEGPNLVGGALNIDWSNPSATGVFVGDGWYRFSMTVTAIDEGVNLLVYPAGTNVDTGTVIAWGAQLELGSTATDYQPIADDYGPFVKGAGQTGGTLLVDGASPDEEGFLLAGDYIQLGSGSSATLHKVLVDVDTNEAGEATLEIWPGIRTAPADNAVVSVADCKGVFRLATNQQSWSINDSSAYGLQFDCMEAI
jgi:hypothetical protein